MIELWLSPMTRGRDDPDTVVIKNVQCVPRVGELVEIPNPVEVRHVKYDYHESNGDVRVHILYSPSSIRW